MLNEVKHLTALCNAFSARWFAALTMTVLLEEYPKASFYFSLLGVQQIVLLYETLPASSEALIYTRYGPLDEPPFDLLML